MLSWSSIHPKKSAHIVKSSGNWSCCLNGFTNSVFNPGIRNNYVYHSLDRENIWRDLCRNNSSVPDGNFSDSTCQLQVYALLLTVQPGGHKKIWSAQRGLDGNKTDRFLQSMGRARTWPRTLTCHYWTIFTGGRDIIFNNLYAFGVIKKLKQKPSVQVAWKGLIIVSS